MARHPQDVICFSRQHCCWTGCWQCQDEERGAGAGCGAALTPLSPQEALQCVQELGSPSLLYVFVRNGIESTLERSTISREHMGVLLCHLVKAGTLSKEQYYKG